MRIAVAFVLALLPNFLSVWLYSRLFGFRIGSKVRLQITMFVGVKRCQIGDGAHLGYFNLFWNVEDVEIGSNARIGVFNLFRGGRKVKIGSFVTILRQNTFNSIPEPDLANEATPILEIGDGAVVTSGHWLDFTDHISIGECSILGGRNSSLWTHNRQRTRPISIGSHCYLGSEIRIAPGVRVAGHNIVALGAVLMETFDQTQCLIAGNPARVIRPLRERDLFLVTHKTRDDLPEHADLKDLAAV
ncbi:MAG TPA: hypothetical protein VMP01_10345 [Pirellulaceae bacterium]|nr:hypothetical protein [Pirellulaceae bacterium]